MKILCGLVLIIVGVILGLYIGVWWAFVGGIVQIIEQAQVESIDALTVAWGIAKVLCAGLFGVLSGIIPVMIGIFLVTDD